MAILTHLSAVFQAGGLVVVLVEVARKAYLASLVPVIVNAILNEHQIVVDIVAFVNKGDFPRSRLGEKQRGKILGSWVTRKMRTMAQFGIRDAEGGLSDVIEGSEPRTGAPSARNGSVIERSSLRNVESISEMPRDRYSVHNRYSPPPPPAGFVEMPGALQDDGGRQDTPTQAYPETRPNQSVGGLNLDFSGQSDRQNSDYADSLRSPTSGRGGSFPGQPERTDSQLPPAPGPKPLGYVIQPAMPDLPPPPPPPSGDLYSLPSQRPHEEAAYSRPTPSAGLRIANPTEGQDEDWGKEVGGYLDYAGRRHVS